MAQELAHILHGHADDLAGYRQHPKRMETEAEASAYLIRCWLGSDDDSADDASSPPATSQAGTAATSHR